MARDDILKRLFGNRQYLRAIHFLITLLQNNMELKCVDVRHHCPKKCARQKPQDLAITHELGFNNKRKRNCKPDLDFHPLRMWLARS